MKEIYTNKRVENLVNLVSVLPGFQISYVLKGICIDNPAQVTVGVPDNISVEERESLIYRALTSLGSRQKRDEYMQAYSSNDADLFNTVAVLQTLDGLNDIERHPDLAGSKSVLKGILTSAIYDDNIPQVVKKLLLQYFHYIDEDDVMNIAKEYLHHGKASIPTAEKMLNMQRQDNQGDQDNQDNQDNQGDQGDQVDQEDQEGHGEGGNMESGITTNMLPSNEYDEENNSNGIENLCQPYTVVKTPVKILDISQFKSKRRSAGSLKRIKEVYKGAGKLNSDLYTAFLEQHQVMYRKGLRKGKLDRKKAATLQSSNTQAIFKKRINTANTVGKDLVILLDMSGSMKLPIKGWSSCKTTLRKKELVIGILSRISQFFTRTGIDTCILGYNSELVDIKDKKLLSEKNQSYDIDKVFISRIIKVLDFGQKVYNKELLKVFSNHTGLFACRNCDDVSIKIATDLLLSRNNDSSKEILVISDGIPSLGDKFLLEQLSQKQILDFKTHAEKVLWIKSSHINFSSIVFALSTKVQVKRAEEVGIKVSCISILERSMNRLIYDNCELVDNSGALSDALLKLFTNKL